MQNYLKMVTFVGQWQANFKGVIIFLINNITHPNLLKDGLHLLDNGKQILANNFVYNVKRNFLISGTFHPDAHLTAA